MMDEIDRILDILTERLNAFDLPEQKFEAYHVADQIDILKRAKTIIRHYDTI